MIGLDTNVLLRYFMQDDTRQSSKAAALIETLSRSNQGFVSLVVIVELVWALSYTFQLERGEVRTMLKRLVNMPELKIEKAVHFLRALLPDRYL
jgi:predicted nucleic-acid-binding protein